MKKLIPIFIINLIFSCLSCRNSQESVSQMGQFTVKPVSASDVEVLRVNTQKFDSEIVTNGKISSVNKADVIFSSSETIAKIYVRNGMWIEKGQTIAILDNFLLINKLEQAQIQFEKVKILFYDLLIGLGYSYKNLTIIPDNVLYNAKLKSGYLAAENELKLNRYNYNLSILRAPISGVIANLYAKEKNHSQAGELLCSIIDNKNMEVIFPVMESELSLVKLNNKVTISPYFGEKSPVEGIICNINPLIEKSGLITIKAKILNPSKIFHEGMNVKVFLELPFGEKLFVPKSAVVNRSSKKVVFTYKNGIAYWNYVTTGSENSKSIVIDDGLSNGDSVIYNGNLHLSDGAVVKLKN